MRLKSILNRAQKFKSLYPLRTYCTVDEEVQYVP